MLGTVQPTNTTMQRNLIFLPWPLALSRRALAASGAKQFRSSLSQGWSTENSTGPSCDVAVSAPTRLAKDIARDLGRDANAEGRHHMGNMIVSIQMHGQRSWHER